MKQLLKSRIAPTPSGYLHFGNAFNFILTALLVDLKKGHLHLRIDDFDRYRLKKTAVEDIFIQLDWLGIEYDSGPSGPDEFFSKYSQQLRIDLYYHAIEKIKEKISIFGCECSRSQIRQFSSKGKYPGTCRYKNIDLKRKNLPWRINIPHETIVKYKTFAKNTKKIQVDNDIGDFIIKRRDGLPSYQIISLVEDLEQGVNLIVRGKDLFSSTGAQLFLAESLNERIFLDALFVHHQLIKNDSGEKLSKSFGDLSLNVLKNKFYHPTFIFQKTAKLLDLPFSEIGTLDQLKDAFRTSKNKKKFLDL